MHPLPICTFLRICMEVPPVRGAEAAGTSRRRGHAPFPPQTVFSFVKWAQGKAGPRSFSPALKMSDSEGSGGRTTHQGRPKAMGVLDILDEFAPLLTSLLTQRRGGYVASGPGDRRPPPKPTSRY